MLLAEDAKGPSWSLGRFLSNSWGENGSASNWFLIVKIHLRQSHIAQNLIGNYYGDASASWGGFRGLRSPGILSRGATVKASNCRWGRRAD